MNMKNNIIVSWLQLFNIITEYISGCPSHDHPIPGELTNSTVSSLRILMMGDLDFDLTFSLTVPRMDLETWRQEVSFQYKLWLPFCLFFGARNPNQGFMHAIHICNYWATTSATTSFSPLVFLKF